ncbi:hypothetical protein PLICRDRAFT_172290 [Plicaturopsis crispa FD-325 SS-3]|nr:hypothetical protein PLICRDRAFT_172290 [Plicaturopsis crispa FD-325 SS-3]
MPPRNLQEEPVHTPSPTVLSTLQKHTTQDAIAHEGHHPFAAASGSTIASLKDLVNVAEQLSHSLQAHSAHPFNNPKVVSQLRQHAAIQHTLHSSEQNVHQITQALRVRRPGTVYGEDIPLSRARLVEWCITRFEAWGTAAGMEMFKEPENAGRVTLVFGGKVLVVDIDFSVVHPEREEDTRLDVAGVKTSYAIPNEGDTAGTTHGTNTGGSATLDAFLARGIRAFLQEVHKTDGERNPIEAERLGRRVCDWLAYLMLLDELAKGVEGGVKWFTDVDQVNAFSGRFACSEAGAIAALKGQKSAPLDIFLQRAHGLPLPYFISPSVSFLVYLSPLAYLTLSRTSPPIASSLTSGEPIPDIDVAHDHLRAYLSDNIPAQGVTLATLILTRSAPSNPLPPIPLTRPAQPPKTLPLPNDDHIFPAPPEQSNYSWVLDFTSGGSHRGVVMSQGRMRAVERVLYPDPDPDSLEGMMGIGAMDVDVMTSMGMNGMGIVFRTGSWIDLLLNPVSNTISPERYTTLYHSPTGIHPPLHLRLTPPDEPGFILEHVPVRSMQDVWGVLEIVREQCWLNEVLTGCPWTAEGLHNVPRSADPDPESEDGDAEPTDEDLQAVLSGIVNPIKIPVNVYIPTGSSPGAPPTSAASAPPPSASPVAPRPNVTPATILMTAPERAPISGLVEISVNYDSGAGVRVAVRGGFGMVGGMLEGGGVEGAAFEEVCRRGGTFGLAGRVWASSGSGS